MRRKSDRGTVVAETNVRLPPVTRPHRCRPGTRPVAPVGTVYKEPQHILRVPQKISQRIIENYRYMEKKNSGFYLTGSFIAELMRKLKKWIFEHHPQLFKK